MEGVCLAITAALITVICIHLMIPLAIRMGFVDVARGHKNHEGEVPPIGGLAMYMSLALAQAIWLNVGNDGFVTLQLMASAGILVLIGAVDDRFALPIKLRFTAQVVSILIVALSQGTVLHSLGQLVSTRALELHIFALPLTVFAVVAAINAMNFVDGVDGLAGGLAIVSMSLIAAMAMVAGRAQELSTCLALLGCVSGFLVFNLRCFGRLRARIFMGDAGSMFLGLMISSLLISLSQGPRPAIMPAMALWLFALPLLNALGVIVVRLSAGSSLFRADRLHIHHFCLDAGYTVNQVLIFLLSLHALIASVGCAALLADVPESIMFYGFCALSIGYTLIAKNPKRLGMLLTHIHPIIFGSRHTKFHMTKQETPRSLRLTAYSWQGVFGDGKHVNKRNRSDTLSLRRCSRETTE
jgi:UDP-GlcNAc:undecaprenyl-phosphate GlcNAc-1-phosphate transferase